MWAHIFTHNHTDADTKCAGMVPAIRPEWSGMFRTVRKLGRDAGEKDVPAKTKQSPLSIYPEPSLLRWIEDMSEARERPKSHIALRYLRRAKERWERRTQSTKTDARG